MVQITQCPICNQGEFNKFLRINDHSISSESFDVIECSTCHFLMTSPRPDSDQLGRYYESSDYISHSDTNAGLINKLYRFVRNYTLNQKVNLVQKLNKNPFILDIGSGAGYFMSQCKSARFKCVGIEPDEKTREQSIQKFNIEVYPEDHLNKIEKESVDIITLWHVLEHVPELQKRIQQIETCLKPNGYLIIAVPNAQSYDAKYYQSFWAGYDVPRHLWHFTPQTINKLLSAHPFNLFETRNMYFDSFYVSMLSEKYKQRFAPLLKGLAIGFISNCRALFSKQPLYSSQIYIFKKRDGSTD